MHATAQGVIAGANMVLVDFHPVPGKALVDGPQALLIRELPFFWKMSGLRGKRTNSVWPWPDVIRRCNSLHLVFFPGICLKIPDCAAPLRRYPAHFYFPGYRIIP